MLNEDTQTFIRQHANDDVRRLALRGSSNPNVNLPEALQQISGRQKAKDKFPALYEVDGILYPPSISIEQASSELTANYKSSLLKGDSVIDLTAGFGIDSLAFAKKCKKIVAVEINKNLFNTLSYNIRVLNINNIETVLEDATLYLTRTVSVDTIYIDAARRDIQGIKLVDITQCEPNILEIKTAILGKCKRLIVKLSPMLDIKSTLRKLPETTEIHIVALKNECKELLFVLESNGGTTNPKIEAINMTGSFLPGTQIANTIQTFDFFPQEEEITTLPLATSLGTYLYEPNAALMKSGAYKLIGVRFRVTPLHYHTHLYTSETFVADFPGRRFKIISTSSFAKKEVKNLLQGITQAHVMTRNFPISSDELKKKLKIHEGGEFFIIGTTLYDGEKRLLLATLVVG